jgi:hypothetical protein
MVIGKQRVLVQLHFWRISEDRQKRPPPQAAHHVGIGSMTIDRETPDASRFRHSQDVSNTRGERKDS